MSLSLSILIRRCACCLVLAVPLAGRCQLTSTNAYFSNVNLAIPDGNLSGVATSQTISGLSGTIDSLAVGLTLTGTGDGAFNGDFYATLVNSSGGFVVLLNRPGVTANNPFGYSDNGMAVTFTGGADDIHDYQNEGGDLNNSGQLTGVWAPDGRNVSPLSSLDTTPRTTSLADFNGLTADGTWTLFLVDASNGATAQLSDWSLSIQTIEAAPEPSVDSLAILCGLGAIIMAARQPRRHQGSN